MPYKHDYDKAMTRLSVIINKLYEGEEVSIKELAKEFGVSTKTIQRDLGNRLVSFPIERQGNTFRMMEGHRIEKRFDPQDMLILDVLEKLSENIGPEFAMRAKQLLSKLKNEDQSPIYTKMMMEDISKKATEVTQLERAILEKREVRFAYQLEGFTHALDVKPLKIVCFDGFWYLLGMDARNDIIKKYYLNHLSALEIKETKFRVPKKIEERLEGAINIWFDPNREPFLVRLHADTAIAKYFHRRPIAKGQIIESCYEDGSIDLSVRITDYNEIIPVVMYWIPNLQVLEPLDLKGLIEERLRGYLDTGAS